MRIISLLLLLYAYSFSFMVFCLDENVLNSMLGTYTYVVLNTYVNFVVMSLIYEKGIKLVFANCWLIFSSEFFLIYLSSIS